MKLWILVIIFGLVLASGCAGLDKWLHNNIFSCENSERPRFCDAQCTPNGWSCSAIQENYGLKQNWQFEYCLNAETSTGYSIPELNTCASRNEKAAKYDASENTVEPSPHYWHGEYCLQNFTWTPANAYYCNANYTEGEPQNSPNCVHISQFYGREPVDIPILAHPTLCPIPTEPSPYYWHGEYCLKNEIQKEYWETCIYDCVNFTIERPDLPSMPIIVHPDLCPPKFDYLAFCKQSGSECYEIKLNADFVKFESYNFTLGCENGTWVQIDCGSEHRHKQGSVVTEDLILCMKCEVN